MKGVVIQGSRNIFTVKPEAGEGIQTEVSCHIKGKILHNSEGYYNPLAPGDIVRFEPTLPNQGRILGVEPRKTRFTRLQKGSGSQAAGEIQILAANVDLLLCVTTPASPPFRPRFLDRLLVQAEYAGIAPLIICNKADLAPADPDVEERLSDFVRIGYPVVKVSALTGAGMDALRDLLKNRLSVLVGQSGVGKSSLIKALIPNLEVKIGPLNEKYDRGTHTTALARLLEISGGGRIIDTPGVRRFATEGLVSEDVIAYMPEFAPLAGTCTYGRSCSHRTEPGCKILEGVTAGAIHEDRYASFLRIQAEAARQY